MTTTVGLKLEPLDVLFFRDGRPFGQATHGTSGLPLPQTLAGALWTALLERNGCSFPQLAEAVRQHGSPSAAVRALGGERFGWVADLRIRGPWLARHRTDASRQLEVLVPVPAVIHRLKGDAGRSDARLAQLRPVPPASVPGWTQSHDPAQAGLWPLWLSGTEPTEPAKGFLTPQGLARFLAGEAVAPGDLVDDDTLYGFDRRTGIGMDPHRYSAQEGLIYGATYLALRPDVVLYAEVVVPDAVPDKALDGIDTLAFGGEGRRARVELLRDQRRFAWPEHRATAPRRPFVMLTTPGLFGVNWRPDRFSQAGPTRLVAAAVPSAIPLSGWDLARGGPKPTRFAVPAGSVYFLNESLDPWPDSLADRADDRAQGWGCYVKGAWNGE